MQHALDGSTMRWHLPGLPGLPGLPEDVGDVPAQVPAMAAVPVAITLSPVRPGHAVTVEWRVDGGPVREVMAVPAARSAGGETRAYTAMVPGCAAGDVHCLPVLRQAGQPLTPRLGEPGAVPGRYRVAPPKVPPEAAAHAEVPNAPRFAWNLDFLGALTATVRPERVGPTPDGLRIDWHVVEGHFAGPGLDARVLPGATDWMRIRQDGMGIVSVQACFETRDGVRIFGSYGGMFDLGRDGYARALRDDYDPLPPVVVTPTYATADQRLAWLNRVQCVGIGRVDMRARRVQFDVYRVVVGAPLESSVAPSAAPPAHPPTPTPCTP